MSEYVSAQLRRTVRERASGGCEYCWIHEDDCLLPHEPEDVWKDHFELCGDGTILGRTSVGRATVDLLRMNRPEQLETRQSLIGANLYPPKAEDQDDQRAGSE